MPEKEELVNPRAFPKLSTNYQKGTDGMSLRDYFAGQAIVGILSNYNIEELKVSFEEIIPKLAYMYADAMLKERSK